MKTIQSLGDFILIVLYRKKKKKKKDLVLLLPQRKRNSKGNVTLKGIFYYLLPYSPPLFFVVEEVMIDWMLVDASRPTLGVWHCAKKQEDAPGLFESINHYENFISVVDYF
uniref:dTDP-4-dehydrorhamnose 3,5-epimerase n=1 Tax=Caenorhabditis tropicalis TaxID=1561998 RepID=A0A1I7TIW7_9PELO